MSPEFTERHDFVVYWVLRMMPEATGAPEDVRSRLMFGSGVLGAEYQRGDQDEENQIVIRAGGSYCLDAQLYHNKSDIVIK